MVSKETSLDQDKTVFFTLNRCVHRTVGREFIWHWWSWAGAAEYPAQQPAWNPAPIPSPPVQPLPLHRQSKHKSYHICFSALPFRIRGVTHKLFQYDLILSLKTLLRNYDVLSWVTMILWKQVLSCTADLLPKKPSDTEMFCSLMQWVVPPFKPKQRMWGKRDCSPGREKPWVFQVLFFHFLKKLHTAE